MNVFLCIWFKTTFGGSLKLFKQYGVVGVHGLPALGIVVPKTWLGKEPVWNLMAVGPLYHKAFLAKDLAVTVSDFWFCLYDNL